VEVKRKLFTTEDGKNMQQAANVGNYSDKYGEI
jgi:hypothetical protein